MSHFLKGMFFLTCVFSSIVLSADHVNESTDLGYQAKLYFDSNNLEISANVIYIHLEDNLIATNVLRTDQQGLYIFETDITHYEMASEKKWRCPYCYHWWPIGQRCQNKNCPTNQW